MSPDDNWLNEDDDMRLNEDDDMIATEDTISLARARRLYGAASTRGKLIQVCAGEWRREGERWRFWCDPDADQ